MEPNLPHISAVENFSASKKRREQWRKKKKTKNKLISLCLRCERRYVAECKLSSSELICSQSFSLHTTLFNSLQRMTIVRRHHVELRLLRHFKSSASASSRMSQHCHIKANIADINVDDMDRDTITKPNTNTFRIIIDPTKRVFSISQNHQPKFQNFTQ